MDIISIVRKKIDSSQLTGKSPGVLSVLRHIERAEAFYSEGSSRDAPDAFNDVVYRTNQAFEGILKEAYQFLFSKDPTKVSTYTIENQLLRNNILRTRVVDMLKNYRQNWRNPSTHDHTITFDAEEAFLALANVEAFVSILIDQIIEKASYNTAREGAEVGLTDLSNRARVAKASPLVRLCEVLVELGNIKLREISDDLNLESEMLGVISAVLEQSPFVKRVLREPRVVNRRVRYYPDMLLEIEGTSIIFELKRGEPAKTKEVWVDRILGYLANTPFNNAVLMIAGGKGEFSYDLNEWERDKRKATLGVVSQSVQRRN